MIATDKQKIYRSNSSFREDFIFCILIGTSDFHKSEQIKDVTMFDIKKEVYKK